MSDDPTDLRPEIARRMAADPLLSQPPNYYHPTWPGYLQEVRGMPVPTREQFLKATKDVEGLKRADRLAVWRGLPKCRGGLKRRALPHEIAAACSSAGLDEAAAQRVTAAVMAACPPQPRWIASNETATGDWRAEYEGLCDRAGDVADDRRESAGRRMAAKRLKKLVAQYLTFGTPPPGMASLLLIGSTARKRFDAMDAVGREMQRLAVRLGLAAVGQPVYVSTGSVMAEDFKRRMNRQQQIVMEVVTEARGQKAGVPERPDKIERGDGNRLMYYYDAQRVYVDGVWYDLNDEANCMFAVLWEAQGEWVQGRNLGKRPDKTRKRMPPNVDSIIETHTRQGYRIPRLLPK